MTTPAHGPTLLGVDVILVGSILAGVAAMAVLFAIYAAVTVRDPMSKRVKALNARREEMKSGLITSKSRKRQSLVKRTETTDKMKDTLGAMKVLQESQIKIIQQKMAQAGYRNRFGHPAAPVLDRYRERGIEVVDSARCGASRWRSDAPGAPQCERKVAQRYWHHVVP